MLPSSPRLEYQHLTLENLSAFVSLAQDSHVRQFLMEGLEISEEECRELILRSEQLKQDLGLGLYLVSENSVIIGYCGFMEAHGSKSDLDVVYAFPKNCTGQGLATEVSQALVKLFKETCQTKNLTAVAHPDNKASIRVLEKTGFKQIGPGLGELNHLLRYRL